MLRCGRSGSANIIILLYRSFHAARLGAELTLTLGPALGAALDKMLGALLGVELGEMLALGRAFKLDVELEVALGARL
jgi:hypothetical protein